MKLTRRERMGRKLIGLVAVAALATLSACASGGGSKDSGSKDSGPTTTSITDLVVDELAEPDSLDPLYRNTPEAQRYYRLVYSGVLKWNEDGSLAPDLASEMPAVSDGGLTWTIKLRSGMTFHDGAPLTAKDVVYTYQTVAVPKQGSSWLAALAFMKSVEAVDDTTVVLKLTKPYAYMGSRLAMIPILSSATPYKSNDTYATSENGSGPYTLKSQKRGDSIVLARYDGYYGDKPPYKTITFKIVPENAARVADLINGVAQLLPDIPANQVDLIKKRGEDAEIVEKNVSRLFLYPSMNKDRPTSNVNFRLALAYAVNRQQIIDQVFDGAGRPNSTYLTYGTLYHDDKLGLTFGSTPDIAKAKEYLAKSGYDTSRKFSIIANNVPSVVSAMTIVQANLKAIGIDATVKAQDVAGFYPALISGDYDVIAWSSPASTSSGFAPDYVFNGLYSKAGNNYAKFNDPKMDALLNTAMVAQTKEEQAAAWEAVQQYDVETQGNIQLVISQTADAWSKKLVGFKPSATLWLNTVLDVK